MCLRGLVFFPKCLVKIYLMSSWNLQLAYEAIPRDPMAARWHPCSTLQHGDYKIHTQGLERAVEPWSAGLDLCKGDSSDLNGADLVPFEQTVQTLTLCNVMF